MSLITIEVDDRAFRDTMRLLRERVANLAPAMTEIGEELLDSTLRRFASSTAPDGSRWAENSDTTLLRLLAARRGIGKGGTLTKKGVALVGGKKPLIGETRNLSSTINYQVVDSGQTVLVGSPEKYAATHQFGAKKGAFGSTARGVPIPWGDIPARPFLGLSAEDTDNVLDILRRHIARAAGG